MPIEDAGQSGARALRTQHVLFAVWMSILLVLCIGSSALILSRILTHKRAADRAQSARLDPDAPEPGLTVADTAYAEGSVPSVVNAGVYVDRVEALSIPDAHWRVDFYVWFRWTDSTIDPAAGFQLVDGRIDQIELQDSLTEGGVRYALFRAEATITKFFDVSRFPCDGHVLTIQIEHPAYEYRRMRYRADAEQCAVSSRVTVQGYRIVTTVAVVKPHSYRSARGNPRLSALHKVTYSQFRYAIVIARAGNGFYFKMFQALFVAVGIALMAMFIKPSFVDPRFGLGVGALFAAVANSYVASSLVPDTGTLTVADLVNAVGIVTILLTVLQSTISLYVCEQLGNEPASRRFDRVSFWIMAGSYVLLNVLIPVVAS